MSYLQNNKNDIDTCWIIGGSDIYNYFLKKDLCDRIYLTQIENSFECDRFFPNIDKELFEEITQEDVPNDQQQEEDVLYSFHVYQRKPKSLE